MANRRHHYERAFESYLRATRTPYVSVNEARRALLPEKADLSVVVSGAGAGDGETQSLKSFDFVIYGEPANLLIEVKGRQIGRSGDRSPATVGRLENWVTGDDVVALQRWQSLFNGRSAEGSSRAVFRGAFVFLYLCAVQPPDALFQEIFEFEQRWYALRMVPIDAYAERMGVRSPKWGTVHLSRPDFEAVSEPLSAGLRGDGADHAGARSAGEPPRRVSSTPSLHAELRRQAGARAAMRGSAGLARVGRVR